jgi:hypothetical protein
MDFLTTLKQLDLIFADSEKKNSSESLYALVGILADELEKIGLSPISLTPAAEGLSLIFSDHWRTRYAALEILDATYAVVVTTTGAGHTESSNLYQINLTDSPSIINALRHIKSFIDGEIE